jgi:hypothetical protein
MAEARGFEPPVPVSKYNDLANRRLKPLGHASVGRAIRKGQGDIKPAIGPCTRPSPGRRSGAPHAWRTWITSPRGTVPGSGCGPRVDGVWSGPLRRPVGRNAERSAADGKSGEHRAAARSPMSVRWTRARPSMVGRSQVVRQRILIPSCGGSNPPAPAKTAATSKRERRPLR